ncbi:LysR family transcriptional regulator [Saccharospirillum alexandrii]|uniref:LysR family transcriptional regulator n=1 Tax=Saccharospirillum alexandrii TaxID=2448477 RepID=UPI000FD9FBAC
MNPVTFPPLNTLRAFASAAGSGSFAAAAGELNLTSATISHRIKALEGRSMCLCLCACHGAFS